MTGIRDYETRRKREERKAVKLVQIPKCQDRERRELLESDDAEWLRYYFDESACPKDPFSYPFVGDQLAMIEAIRKAIIEGGDHAQAAPRGGGKTTLFERMLTKYTLQGLIKFSVLFAATGTLAEASLDSIKEQLENNDRLLWDYPEVCVPVRALENTPNRAHYQIASGFRHDNGEPYEAASTKFSWSGQEIVLPKVPGSPSSEAIIATRGLDSAVRGIKRKGRRVDVAGIDDPDTEESARSEEQAKKLEDRIDRGIAGLGSQKRTVARVMLTTCQSRISVSYKYTDPMQKPSFQGRRFKFLITPPTNIDLWDKYVELKHADWRNGTTLAHEWYVANREAMDLGAVVGNPHRYVQGELSALQHFYNLIAKLGPDAVATEYQNDPPEDSGPVESGITPILIQKQLTGLPKGVIPDGCEVLTHTVDVGKWKLHWVVRAWKMDGTGFTIDYGVQDVHGPKFGAKETEGLDRALRREVLRRIDEFRSASYRTNGGEEIRESITLVDAGYRTHAIYAACAEAGIGVYPVMGFGKSAGCCGISFTPANKRTTDVIAYGEDWKMVRAAGRVRLVECSADKWKAWEHDRWMTATDKPGCMFLYGERSEDPEKLSGDEIHHRAYAQQICAEVEVEEMVKGVLKRKWKAKGENHWLDASYYSCVAAAIKGVRLPMVATAKSKSVPATSLGQMKPRIALKDMAKRH